MCVWGGWGVKVTSCFLQRNEQGTLKNYGSIMKFPAHDYRYLTVSNSHSCHSEVKLLRKSFQKRLEFSYHFLITRVDLNVLIWLVYPLSSFAAVCCDTNKAAIPAKNWHSCSCPISFTFGLTMNKRRPMHKNDDNDYDDNADSDTLIYIRCEFYKIWRRKRPCSIKVFSE